MKDVLLLSGILLSAGIWAAPVLPGYLTDPSVVREKMGKGETYETPEAFRYPYVSTYYVKPTVTAMSNGSSSSERMASRPS